MTPEQIKALNDIAATFDSELAKYTLLSQGVHSLIDLAEQGYQTDNDTISKMVEARVGEIADENASLISILQNLGYNPDGTPITQTTNTNEISSPLVDPMPTNPTE